MKLHRFFAGDLHDKFGPVQLRHHVWVNDQGLVNQWVRVLRLGVGDQLVLFNGQGEDRLYKIHKIEDTSVGLELVTELEPNFPKAQVYLFFCSLKKDKNEWVLQKCTELGVSHLVPIISERTEKTGFDIERANKIVTEASEQCGRSDIPRLREPVGLQASLDEFKDKIHLFYAEQHEEDPRSKIQDPRSQKAVGIFIGPEGGWTDTEKQLLDSYAKKLNIAQFTLRAETACVVAAVQLLQ